MTHNLKYDYVKSYVSIGISKSKTKMKTCYFFSQWLFQATYSVP
jgi:hypothetical protein